MRKVIIVLGLMLLVIPAVSAQAPQVVDFNPNNVDSLFEVGKSQRACYVANVPSGTTIKEISVTPPSNIPFSPGRDSERCISFLVNEVGKWIVSVTTESSPLGQPVEKKETVAFVAWLDQHPTTIKDGQTVEIQRFMFFPLLFMAIWVMAEWKKDPMYYLIALMAGAYIVMNIPSFLELPRALFLGLCLWIGVQFVREVIGKEKRQGAY